MTRLSRSDRALLNAARKDLRDAPKILGYGRADALRSAPFRARYRGVCSRCRKRIDIGDDIRYHNDFADPVHVRCREPSTRTEPGTHVAETRSAERESRLSELLDPTRRTMLVAPDNRCFGAFWCVHSDQAGLLAFAVVVHSAGVADCDRGPTDSDGARAGACCSA